MTDRLAFDAGEACSTITLDDGQANVLSIDMLSALDDALDRAEAEEQPLVLAGRDGMFSGGFDIAVFEADDEALVEMLTAGAEITERLLSYPYPVVVACTGHAIAMGLFLVLAGDERIGAAGEFALQANEVEIGLTLPRFATELCRQRLTPAAFSRATTLATRYEPTEAQAAGILDRVVPADEVRERARDTARSLARIDMAAHAATKRRVREDALTKLRAAIEADVAEWQTANSSTERA